MREVKGHSVTFKAGTCGNLRLFDASYFKMNKSEAQSLDPQQRLVLEMSVDALEDAGIKAEDIKGSNTSVFIGAASTDMAFVAADDAAKINAYSMTGTNLSIISNRLSYYYDLHGESMTIDTACSSSMTAVCKAFEALSSGSCDLAFAGGVNVLLSPMPFVGFSQAHMLSANGKCKVFSKDADGYVRSEGGALLILKRLSDAVSSLDNIIGVIKAASLNQDGSTSGIALPNAKAQQSLIERVYKDRSLEKLVYVEAHGTGTQAGDPIECSAIGKVLGSRIRDEEDRSLYIGSVKCNTGHLETASGMAGILKSLLILKHREIPRQIWVDELNPNIDFDKLNLKVVRENIKLDKDISSLQIGINSFGFGGSNAHILIESAPSEESTSTSSTSQDNGLNDKFSLMLSAKTEGALRLYAKDIAEFLKEKENLPVSHIAATYLKTRELYAKRVVFDAKTRPQLIKLLENFSSNNTGKLQELGSLGAICETSNLAPKGKTAFIFSGNGSQYRGMGALLYAKEKVFADAFDKASKLLFNISKIDYKEIVKSDDNSYDLSSPVIAQPLIFAIQYALFEFIKSKGLNADGCSGHSVGEVASACICGALSLEDACKLIVKRSFYQEKTSKNGAMAAVKLSYEKLCGLLKLDEYKSISIAAYNAPDSFTLSGDKDLISKFSDRVKALRGVIKVLKLNYAFHSDFMDPIENDLKKSLSDISPKNSDIDFYSSVYGRKIPSCQLNADYWWQNVRKPVRFSDTCKSMIEDGFTRFIEIGPQAILSSYLKHCVSSSDVQCIVSNITCKNDSYEINKKILSFIASGLISEQFYFNLSKVDRFISLPHYAFERRDYWVDDTPSCFNYLKPEVKSILLGCKLPYNQGFINELDVKKQVFFSGHEVQGEVLLPFATYLISGLKAAEYFATLGRSMRLLNLELFMPVSLSSGIKEFKIEVQQDNSIIFNIRPQGTNNFAKAASCRALPYEAKPSKVDIKNILEVHNLKEIEPSSLYLKASELGINYHDEYRRIKSLYASSNCALAKIDMHYENGLSSGDISVAGLDAALQLLFAVGLFADNLFSLEKLYLPSQVDEFCFIKKGEERIYALLKIVALGRSSIVCDIDFFDELGFSCGFMSGCRYKLVPQEDSSVVYSYSDSLVKSPLIGMTGNFDTNRFLNTYKTLKNSGNFLDFKELSDIESLFSACLCSLALKHIKFKQSEPLLPEQLFDCFIDEKAESLALFLLNLLCEFDLANYSDETFSLVENIKEIEKELDFDKLCSSLILEYPQSAATVELLMLIDLKLEDYFEFGDISVFSKNLTYLLKRVESSSQQNLFIQSILGKCLKDQKQYSLNNSKLRVLVLSTDFPQHKFNFLEQNGDEVYKVFLDNHSFDLAVLGLDLFSKCRVLSLNDFINCACGKNLPYFDAVLITSEGFNYLKKYGQDKLLQNIYSALKESGLLFVQKNTTSLSFKLCEIIKDRIENSQNKVILKQNLDEYFKNLGLEEIFFDENGCSFFKKTAKAYDFDDLAQAKEILDNLCLPINNESLSYGVFNGIFDGDRLYRCIKPSVKPDVLSYQLYNLSKFLIQKQGTSESILFIIDGQDENSAGIRAIIACLRTARHEFELPLCKVIVLKQGLPSLNDKCNQRYLENIICELRLDFNFYEEVFLDASERYLSSINLDKKEKDDTSSNVDDVLNRSLIFDKAGRLSSLHFCDNFIKKPKDNEVLIEVKATALNYRDVMWASGLLPDEALENGFVGESLGLECSGKVKALGDKVCDLNVGDEVIAFAPSSFSDYIVTKRDAVLLKPENLSFAKAASLPVVYFTAYYSLKCKALAQAGESILIHGGAGGVGLAALQIAKLMGLKIYATAGSELKRRLLLSLGADHVYNSRSYAFADEIRADVGNKGIDIVLNSLSDDGAALSLELLSPLGRFIELGKRDFYADNSMHLKHFKDNLSYFAVDADALLKIKPDFCSKLMSELLTYFEKGLLKTIPVNFYLENEVVEAFNDLRSSTGIGKLVVLKDSIFTSCKDIDKQDNKFSKKQIHKKFVYDKGTCIITGGLGGLGIEIAKHLVYKGCSHLVIIGRRSLEKASKSLEALKSKLNGFEVKIDYIEGDISNQDLLLKSIEALNLKNVNLCIHAAGFLNDALITDLKPSDYETQLKVKFKGALNLILCLKYLNILPNCFVFFSSVASLFGNPGQCAYASANAASEGVSITLKEQGVRALCIGWGPVSGVGMLDGRENILKVLKRRLGTAALTVRDVINALDNYLDKGASGIHYCFKADWNLVSSDIGRDMRFVNVAKHFNIRANSVGDDILNELLKLKGEDLENALYELVITEVSKLLGSTKEEIKSKNSLQDLGLDSLSLMELTSNLSDLLKLQLSPEVFATCSSLHGFAKNLAILMQGGEDNSLMISAMEEQHGLNKLEVNYER